MYAQLLKKATGRRTGAANARVHTLPAPIGGWNARDALSAMKAEDAIILDNIIPDAGRVRLRPGYQRTVTGLTGLASPAVETLMEYCPPDVSQSRLFAATSKAIYDATLAAASPAPSLDGTASGRWQHVNFAAGGNNFLACVNGVNNFQTFNGTQWIDQDAAITGIPGGTGEFCNIAMHARRLWFCANASLDAYYLPVLSISGQAKKLPLGPLCAKGGHLLAIGTWTKDGGDGMDDLWVGVTSRGEVVVYQGTDPDTQGEWTLVGVFTIAEPVGRRCLIKVGSDLGIVTSTGVALLSQLIGANKSGQRKITITNKIATAFVEAYRAGGTQFGWQIVEFPSQNLVIINVPVRERVEAVQFVVNVETGGWCRFTGIPAQCWSLLGDRLFCGLPDGSVAQFGEALSDDGAPIPWMIQIAYNKCGRPSHKIFRMVRPLIVAAPGYRPGVGIMLDYDSARPTVVPPPGAAATSGAAWDQAVWDVASWAASTETRKGWQSVTGQGSAVSVCMAGLGAEITFEFNEVDVMYEPGSWL